MARYIDADKVAARIKESPAFRNINDGFLLQRVAIDLLNNMPAANVVPKSEVAIEVCCKIEEEIVAALESNYKVVSKFVESDSLYYTVNGKISALRGIEGFVEELKKKYTGEK